MYTRRPNPCLNLDMDASTGRPLTDEDGNGSGEDQKPGNTWISGLEV